MRLHSARHPSQRLGRCGLRSGYMRLHSPTLDRFTPCCGLRSGYMRLHLSWLYSRALVGCGLRSGYMRLHSSFSVYHHVNTLWFAVRLYAITLERRTGRRRRLLWFAVRLYAITLAVCSPSNSTRCGLRSGYMRLHSTMATRSSPSVVVCGQAICDYTRTSILMS